MSKDWYNKQELTKLGFINIGKNVKISRLSKFYNFKGNIGNEARIDDFSILKGNIDIGENVHLAAFSYLGAINSYISIGKLTGIGARTSIFAATDDFIGNFLTNPTVDKDYKNIIKGDVIIGKNVSIGSGCILLPKINIANHVSVSALSLVSKDLLIEGGVYSKVEKLKSIYKKNIDIIAVKEKQFTNKK